MNSLNWLHGIDMYIYVYLYVQYISFWTEINRPHSMWHHHVYIITQHRKCLHILGI